MAIRGRITDGNNSIFGDNLANEIDGLGGNDAIQGYGGDDTLYGGDGNDSLSGGNGRDHLYGGRGKDVLTGNGQSDVFHFVHRTDSPAGTKRDAISDFYHGWDSSKRDSIDLSELGPLTFIGTDEFSAPGQVRWHKETSGPVVVQINLEGAGSAEMEIELRGLSGSGDARPEADWFVLE